MDRLRTMIVTHFDADHWEGLRLLAQPLGELPNPPHLELVYPRLPDTAADAPAASLALLVTLRGTGVRVLELAGALERMTSVDLTPLARGQRFDAAGRTWHVMWPPRTLRPEFGRALDTAVRDTEALADDLAADGFPELRDNLDAAYRRPFPGGESTPAERAGASGEVEPPRDSDDELSQEVGEMPDLDAYEGPHGHPVELRRIPEEFRARFAMVSRRVAAANNNLSLVFHDERGSLAVFGDAHSSVLKHALEGMEAEYAVVLAPHHGTYPVPATFPRANVCVAQAGRSHHERWMRHVDTHYQPRSCVSTAEIGSLSVW